MSLAEVKAKHPGPWSYAAGPGGLIVMFDANGQQVPLFLMLDIAVMVSQRLVPEPAPEENPA